MQPPGEDAAIRPLRVQIVTTDDPVYTVGFFEAFLRDLPRDRVKLCGITVGIPFRDPRIVTIRRFVGLYGVMGFVRLATRFAASRVSGLSVRTLAERHGVPHDTTPSVNDPEYVARMRARELDVIVSVAAPEIFGEALLAVPRLGCVNLHSGALPAYRGVMPVFWQMANGESHATVTAHQMTPRIDVGGILGTATFPIRPRDSLDRAMREAKQVGARLMADTLVRMAEGRAHPTPMRMEEARWCRFPTPADVRALRARGHTLR